MPLQRLLPVLFLLTSTGIFAGTVGAQMTKGEYIETYKYIAIKEMKRTGVPASITLAQGILESGFGNSKLAHIAKNHFGIKCHTDWKGRTFYMDDDTKHECFRKYRSAEESFIDHSDFLKNRSRYRFLFDLKITDYKGWAHGLKKAGYATNPKYPQLLIGLIETHELYQYDKPGKIKKEDDDVIASLHNKVFEFNGIRAILTKKGDTPLKIAKKHGIGYKKILKWNDLSRRSKIKPGSTIYLQPKRNKGPKKFHTVAGGESMWDIAQQNGIKLKKLYKRNLMMEGTQVKAGQIIYLRGKRSVPPVHQKSNNPNHIRYHTVKKGDTLYAIANRYHLSVEALMELNQLKDSIISPGDKLRVK